ncbi:MAG: hypothetical protein GC149_09910 [Gammaproteobacteria bacterium]|nr:hypothetical protein [Gammaproteobacteria bacterium]
MKRITPTLLSLLIGMGSGGAYAKTQVTVEKNPKSGMLSWTATDDGLSIQLVQLLPDFVRAVYSKHGLPAKLYNEIAGYCDFGTIFRNTSGKTLDYDVRDWRAVTSAGALGKIKSKSEWAEEWRKAGIHFSWTLFPGAGTFYAGDWQQGFTTIKLPHGTRFDLILKWKIDGVMHTGRIHNMQCASDVTSTP